MKRSPWVYIAIVSLGLNLFFLGFGASRVLKPRPQNPGVGRFEPFRLGALARATGNPELQARAREAMAELRPKWKALRAARHATRAALEATPFDKPALEQALETLRSQSLETQQEMHTILVNLAESLSPEERKRLVEVNWRRPDRQQGRRPKPGDGAPTP